MVGDGRLAVQPNIHGWRALPTHCYTDRDMFDSPLCATHLRSDTGRGAWPWRRATQL
jgi:hypothetical protein